MDRRFSLIAAALVLLVVAAMAFPSVAFASHVEPVFVAGNISGTGDEVCTTLSGAENWFGVKVDPPVSGTFGGVTFTLSEDGRYLDWAVDPASGILVQAVVVKGGPNTNIYYYNPPETFQDTGLHSPNPQNAISHYVLCYQVNLVVEKTYDTTFERQFSWDNTKEADPTSVLLSFGQLFDVTYQVEAFVTGSQDSGWAASGEIRVTNPSPIPVIVPYVTDEMEGIGPVDVVCPGIFIDPGETLVCTWSTDLPNGDSRANTATATSATPGIGDGTDTVQVIFGEPDDLIDECIFVTDDKYGDLGEVCVGDAPKIFQYVRTFGAHPDADEVLVCGEQTVTNVASFVSNDTGATGSAEASVVATVACETGCSLTQGYWKTHADPNNKKYDDNWDNLPQGSATTFFSSGQSYLQVLKAPSNNMYYQLAQQYIAAQLNDLNGADMPEAVDDAFDDATTKFFQVYTPEQIGALKGKDKTAVSNLITPWIQILDAYNNGLVGPGHCDEEPESVTGQSLAQLGGSLFLPALNR